MEREQCPICKKHPLAVNYSKGQTTYYRKACSSCTHKKRRPKPEVAGWIKSGYKKKDRCERCNFKFKLQEQSRVFHLDGNTANVHWQNLRTICLNCVQEITKTSWRPADLQPDF